MFQGYNEADQFNSITYYLTISTTITEVLGIIRNSLT